MSSRFQCSSDDELLADLACVEAIGRLVDGLRIAAAAQVERRSSKALGEQSLAFRSDAKDGVDLVAQVTRVGVHEAKRRVGLGSALAPTVSLTGDPLPSAYPALTAAVAAGTVGVEAARIIVDTALSIPKRVQGADVIAKMVEALTWTAATDSIEMLRDVAAYWVELLHPDGARPAEEEQRRKRAFRTGRTRTDGTTPFSGILTAEHLAALKELLQSRRRGGPLFRSRPGGDPDGSGGVLDPEWQEGPSPDGDTRTRAQQDYDTLVDAVTTALRAEHEGFTGTTVTHEVVITATADEVEARRATGWAPGIMAGLPMPVIERVACSGGVRLLVTGERGESLFLSRSHRMFSSAQKKALVVAAGGRCQIPGCTTPAPYLEAHHVEWWHRDSGPTDIDNGIMLCSHHHHLVHARSAPVHLVKHRGDIYVVPKRHKGPPESRHRRQRGPITDPRARAARRRDDPWRDPFLA